MAFSNCSEEIKGEAAGIFLLLILTLMWSKNGGEPQQPHYGDFWTVETDCSTETPLKNGTKEWLQLVKALRLDSVYFWTKLLVTRWFWSTSANDLLYADACFTTWAVFVQQEDYTDIVTGDGGLCFQCGTDLKRFGAELRVFSPWSNASLLLIYNSLSTL